jgi:hypothetical protein
VVSPPRNTVLAHREYLISMVSDTTYLQVRVDLDSSLTVDMYRGIGGVLPAAPLYGGTTDPVSIVNTGLAFAGGLVPTNLQVNLPFGNVQGLGLDQAFALQQQGLTADVTCQQTNSSAGNLNLNSSFYSIPVPLANGITDYWLWAWNITADCSQGECASHRV